MLEPPLVRSINVSGGGRSATGRVVAFLAGIGGFFQKGGGISKGGVPRKRKGSILLLRFRPVGGWRCKLRCGSLSKWWAF